MTDLAAKLDTNSAAVESADPTQAASIQQQVEKMMPQFAAALPTMLTPDRFLRQALTMFRTTPDLLLCEPLTLKAGLMAAAQLGLEPGSELGQFYLVPFNDKKRKTKVAQIIIGYKGYVALAERSGITISARAVFEGDEFEERAAPEDELWHRPKGAANRSKEKLVATYAIAKRADGRTSYKVCYRPELDEIGDKAFGSSPWKSDFVAMAIKTPIRRIANQLPMAAEYMQRAATFDSAIAQGIDARPDATFDDIEVLDIEAIS